MARVRITNLPTAKSGGSTNIKAMPWPVMSGQFSEPDIEVNHTLNPVPRDQANLEAERGEVVLTQGAGGIPDHFMVGGERHSNGGTPLKLPEDSFIYSDTKNMRIKDPVILKQFGMSPRKAGYTPAEIAKKYDISKFKKVLADPDSDDLQRETAEAMIKNYNLKLAKLALYQESMKGFPQGIPVVAMPYIMANQIDPGSFMGGQGQPSQAGDNSTAQLGGYTERDMHFPNFPGEFFQEGGSKKMILSNAQVLKMAQVISQQGIEGLGDTYNQLGNIDKQRIIQAMGHVSSQPNYGLPTAPTYQEMPLGPDDVQLQKTGMIEGVKRFEKFPGQVAEALFRNNPRYGTDRSFVNPETGNMVSQQGEVLPYYFNIPYVGNILDMALQPSSYIPAGKVIKGVPVAGKAIYEGAKEAYQLAKPYVGKAVEYAAKKLKNLPGLGKELLTNSQIQYLGFKNMIDQLSHDDTQSFQDWNNYYGQSQAPIVIPPTLSKIPTSVVTLKDTAKKASTIVKDKWAKYEDK